MKLIHVSDLHLGKRVYEFSMLEEQKYILQQMLAIIKSTQADGVLLAGDIYDKPVPPAEAVQVFDEFLTRLAELNILVFIISGNHDSAERVAFGAKLMTSKGVYLSPVYDGNAVNVSLTDDYGEVCIHLLPFIKPAVVRHALQMEDIKSYQEAVQAAIGQMEVDTKKRNVLMTHQFVTGASRCESEDISVGGLDQVDAALFDSFDYVALGHIHSPQHVGKETVRYCGSPIKYSFSEAAQEKSLTLVELKEKGTVLISKIVLTPKHDMKKLRGNYMEVMSPGFYQNINTKDYIQMTLTDEEDILDGMQKLRIVYPNLMRLEYDNKRTHENRLAEGTEAVTEKTVKELFEIFYEVQNNQIMSEQQKDFAQRLIAEIEAQTI